MDIVELLDDAGSTRFAKSINSEGVVETIPEFHEFSSGERARVVLVETG